MNFNSIFCSFSESSSDYYNVLPAYKCRFSEARTSTSFLLSILHIWLISPLWITDIKHIQSNFYLIFSSVIFSIPSSFDWELFVCSATFYLPLNASFTLLNSFSTIIFVSYIIWNVIILPLYLQTLGVRIVAFDKFEDIINIIKNGLTEDLLELAKKNLKQPQKKSNKKKKK